MASKNQVISKEAYENALKASWNVSADLDNLFPTEITKWINKKSIELGVPFMYIAYPLLSATAFTLGVSTVKVSETYLEPIIIYSLVSGRSGTNKSGSLSIVKKIVDSLPTNKMSTFDSGTLEGLMSALSQNDGCMLSAVDEFTTFLDSLDKNSNGNAERARYLSLWSGSEWSKQTKNGGLEIIRNPRYNFTGFNQNYFLINLIVNCTHYDGFLQRFLIATPAEVYITLQQKVDSAKETDPINMDNILALLYKNFENGWQFKLSAVAMSLFTNYHDNEVLQYRKKDKFEETKSTIKTKSIGNVLRVAGVQCDLRRALHAHIDLSRIEDAIISREDMEKP